MGYLYGPQNFDLLTPGTIADVTLLSTANFTVGSVNPISGSQAYGTTTGSESNPIGLFTANNGVAIAPTQNMTIQFDTKWGGDYWMCPVLCADTANLNNYVWLLTTTDLFLFQHTGGSPSGPLQHITLPTPPVSGTNYSINASCSVSGSTVSHAFTIWQAGTTMPGTPTATATTTGPLAAGYAGILLFNQDTPDATASVDNLFISTPSPGFTLSPTTGTTGATETVTATGNGNTSWTTGTTFSVSGGTGASISGISVNVTTQVATFTLHPGTSAGTLTISDSTDSATATVAVSAASFTVSPTSASTGVNETITATGTNTNWINGTTTFSVSGGTGASISGLTVSSTTSATFTLHPGSGAGTLTISDNADSATASITVSASYTTLGVTSTGFYATPAWDDDGSGTKASGSQNLRAGSTKVWTQWPGNYLKIGFTSAGTHATVLFDVSHYGSISSGDWPLLKYRVGEGTWHQAQVPSSGRLDVTSAGISGSGTYQLYVVYAAHDYNNDNYGLTSGAIPQNSVVVTGIELDNGATAVSPPIASTTIMLLGDSIPKGESVLGTNSGYLTSDDATLAWPTLLAEAMNAEIWFYCLSGWGYEVAAAGGFPAFASHWQYQSNGRVRDISIQPTLILEVQATNDFVQNTTVGTVQTDVGTVLTAIRAAYASSKIVKCVPFGGFLQTQIAAGFAAAALSNAALYEPSTAISAPMNTSGRTYVATFASVDSIHPNYSYSGVLATSLGSFILAQNPATSDVRYGVTFGASSVGSCHVPTASQVLTGIAVDATIGNVVLPTAGEVESGVTFGANNGTTGTYAGGGAGITLSQLNNALALGIVRIDLTQPVPTSNTAQTVGDALNAARADAFGPLTITQSGGVLTETMYAADGETVVHQFTVATDAIGNPTGRA